MLTRLLTVLALLLLGGEAQAFTHGFTQNPAVVCNIATGIATGTGSGTCIASPPTCNGSADDAAAFATFNSWARTWQGSHSGQIALYIPAGKSCVITGNTVQCGTSGLVKCPFYGILNFLVYGDGPDVSVFTPTGASILGGLGIQGGTTFASRVATASVGSTCVTLLTPAEQSRFTVGNWSVITGFDLQGFWQALGFGAPPNPYYFDYVLISSINAGTGEICFASPLTNTYLSTWPSYDPGGILGPDQGGPATLYVLDPGWNTIAEFASLDIVTTGQIYASGRSSIWRNVRFSSTGCAIPTQNIEWTYINTDASNCTMEVDKIVGTMNVISSRVEQFDFQSASIDRFNLVNSTITQGINGTAKVFAGLNSTIASFAPGATSYGASGSSTCVNCIITAFGSHGATEKGAGDNGIDVTYTMTSGIIKSPNGGKIVSVADNGSGAARLTLATTFTATPTAQFTTGKYVGVQGGPYNGAWQVTVIDGTRMDLVGSTFSGTTTTGSICGCALRWAVPGANLMFTTTAGYNFPVFQVLSVTQDVDFTYVTTNWSWSSGTFPTNAKWIKVHPAPAFTCTNCTGAAEIASLTQAPAGLPLYSWQTHTFTGAVGAAAQTLFKQWGNLDQFNINVTNAYTGGGALNFQLAQFNNWPVFKTDGTTENYGPVVNAKSAGNRQIELSGVTCPSGTCTGDGTLTVPDATLSSFGGANASVFSADVSGSCPGAGCPSVTLTLQTNQGVVYP